MKPRYFFVAGVILAILICVIVAIRVIVAVRDVDYIEDITKRLNSDNGAVRYVAIRQLRQSRHVKAVPELISVVKTEKDAANIREALAGLSEISPDDIRVTSLFLELLDNEVEAKRAGACSGFGSCNHLPGDVEKRLTLMAQTDPSPDVRIACAWTLNIQGVFDRNTARGVIRSAINSPDASQQVREGGERVLNGIP